MSRVYRDRQRVTSVDVGPGDKGEGSARDDGVNHGPTVAAFDETLVRRVHMTLQDPWNVIAIIYPDELAAQRVAVTMLAENLLAGMAAVGVEIHRDVFPIERQTRQGNALGGPGARHLDRGGIANDRLRIVECLAWIPELQTPELRRRFHREKRFLIVLDAKYAPDRLRFVRMSCAASDGSVHTHQRDIHSQHQSAIHGIRIFARLDEQGRATRRGPVDRVLEGNLVDRRRVGWRNPELADALPV